MVSREILANRRAEYATAIVFKFRVKLVRWKETVQPPDSAKNVTSKTHTDMGILK